MLKKLILIGLFAICGAANAFAHALWIETSTTGKAGQKQSVKIIYSEPDDKPEKLADWYSDVKEFELWLTGPDKQKVKIPVTAGEDHFTAEFTPQKDGVYSLSISKSAKDLGGSTIYQFNAGAIVKVGNSLTGNDAAHNGNEISVFTDAAKDFKANKPLQMTTLLKGKPADKLQVSIASPTGWNRNVSSNASGVAEFTPIWAGTYKLEASATEKTEGDHFGKPYKSIWRCATLLVSVAE
ncbi:DUF4198 domain-containing protein [Dyadobacter sp. CY326]|uniref:DUF4198 domain-containing protein n=1 Tax=Dyadobacter sp. CY326 TaxID=2907300 RepID=UPI001F18D133|nr:DUF4198 domain-containing protein [Dyadobacter sp. CY326]MCE7066625.1 DUF4198 domain-containing protein [Dyadobacter sp. CY326]